MYNTEEFIRRARLVHGDKYDYSKVEYVNSQTKVCIICPIHGESSAYLVGFMTKEIVEMIAEPCK